MSEETNIDRDNSSATVDLAPVAPSQIEDQGRRVFVYCAVQMLVAAIACLSAWVEVESISVTCPLLVASGVMVVLTAMRRAWWLLLCFGLSSFWVVGTVAIVISAYRLNPQQATPVVPSILLGFAVLLAWTLQTVYRSVEKNPELAAIRVSKVRFSVRTILLFTAVVAALATIGKYVTWAGEMWIFASIGLVLLGSSALLAMWYHAMLKQHNPRDS